MPARRPGAPRAPRGPFSAVDRRVPSALERPGEDHAVDRAVVDDEDAARAGARVTTDSGRSAASARCDRVVLGRRFDRSSSVASVSSPVLARSSSSRQSSEKCPAPKVAPFDLSVWAARRSSSASPCSTERRSVARSCSGASARNVSISFADEVGSPPMLAQQLERIRVEAGAGCRSRARFTLPPRADGRCTQRLARARPGGSASPT